MRKKIDLDLAFWELTKDEIRLTKRLKEAEQGFEMLQVKTREGELTRTRETVLTFC